MVIPGEPLRREVFPEAKRPETFFESSNEHIGEAEMSSEQTDREEESVQNEAAPVAPAFQAMAPVQQQTKDPILKQVEEILEEDMAETYAALPPAAREKFRKRGEEVAILIQKMISVTGIHAKKVLRLIVSWLRIIPHINRFFLEQEAKIKTDRLMALAEKNKNRL